MSDTDTCCIHKQGYKRWATHKLVVESKETGLKLEKGLCEHHAYALRDGDWDKAAIDTDPRKFQNLKEAAREKDRLTVSVVRKVGEPDRGQSLNLAPDRPLNMVRPEPTIVPPPPPERPSGRGGGSAASAAAAGAGDRSANEASRRSQIRAAVEAGKQAELETVVEQATARQHQAAPGTPAPRHEKSAAEVRGPDLGQGPLTYEDRLSKRDMAGLVAKMGSLGIAAAAGMDVPHMDLPDAVSDAVERSSVNEYPFSRVNAEVTALRAKEKAREITRKAKETLHVAEVKETAERFRSRVEDARYPAQSDQQGFGRDLS